MQGIPTCSTWPIQLEDEGEVAQDFTDDSKSNRIAGQAGQNKCSSEEFGHKMCLSGVSVYVDPISAVLGKDSHLSHGTSKEAA